jgi:hypothetical protein
VCVVALLAGGVTADTLSDMLEPDVKALGDSDPRPATRRDEIRWWLAIVAVLAATLLFVWALGQVS